jgi:SAM domain (Sterile alpha motif)
MDVADWLRALGLERYEATFRENDVDTKLLPNLTADDLRDLGITSVGHRRQLLEAIAALRLRDTPAGWSCSVAKQPGEGPRLVRDHCRTPPAQRDVLRFSWFHRPLIAARPRGSAGSHPHLPGVRAVCKIFSPLLRCGRD